MDQFSPLAQKLQEIEALIASLVTALQQGELPVNLKNISQVFDRAIEELPRLSLPSEKFCAVYNDIPNLLSAYAINVTLTAASYRQTIKPIIFERLYNGNYWIIPIGADPQRAWLVPNPTRKIDLTRLESLSFAFDWPERRSNYQSTVSLSAPAIVRIQPTTPLTWKLVERGTISPYLNTDAFFQSQALTGQYLEIEAMVEQAVADHLATLKLQLRAELLAESVSPVDNPGQSTTIGANLGDRPYPETSAPPQTNTSTVTSAQTLGDMWRQSLTEMMAAENLPSVPAELHPVNPKIPSNLANARDSHRQAMFKMENLGDLQGALDDFDRAIALDPSYGDAYSNRAYLKAYKLGDVNGAVADLSQAIAMNPLDYIAYCSRGSIRANALDFNALADYNQAITINDRYADAYHHRGCFKANFLKDPEGAIEDLLIAAQLYQQQGNELDLREAIEQLRKLGVEG
jgi:tetratricopeptide (TPR) repeat protein